MEQNLSMFASFTFALVPRKRPRYVEWYPWMNAQKYTGPHMYDDPSPVSVGSGNPNSRRDHVHSFGRGWGQDLWGVFNHTEELLQSATFLPPPTREMFLLTHVYLFVFLFDDVCLPLAPLPDDLRLTNQSLLLIAEQQHHHEPQINHVKTHSPIRYSPMKYWR